jgi:outer membrane immunogenic protein
MKKIMSALAILCLTCVASFAQSNNPWQGFYVGAGIGGIYDNNQLKTFVNNIGNASYSGVFNVGYDLANVGPNVFGTNNLLGNNMVVGIWTEGVLAQGKTNVVPGFNLYNNGDWGLGGRMGITVAPNLLVYGTGGYTNGSFAAKGLVNSAALKSLDGYTVGGGAEWNMASNVYVKLEYRHDGFNNAELFAGGKPILQDTVTSNRVTLGLAYKFNGGNSPLPLGTSDYYRPLK